MRTCSKNSSKEFILIATVHESIHAYKLPVVKYTSHQIDSNTFKSQFPIIWKYKAKNDSQHLQMVESYLSEMKQTLQDFNNSIDSVMKNSIPWVGLQQTPAWTSLGAIGPWASAHLSWNKLGWIGPNHCMACAIRHVRSRCHSYDGQGYFVARSIPRNTWIKYKSVKL